MEIAPLDGLLVDFAVQRKATAVIRGLRAVSDFEFEFQMALMNRKLEATVETIFLMPKEEYTYLSSRIVKEIARLGGDVTRFRARRRRREKRFAKKLGTMNSERHSRNENSSSTIPADGLHLEGEEECPIPELAAEDVVCTGPLRYSLDLGISEGALWATGMLAQPVELKCVRCLEPFPFDIEVQAFAIHHELTGPGADRSHALTCAKTSC